MNKAGFNLFKKMFKSALIIAMLSLNENLQEYLNLLLNNICGVAILGT